MITAAINPEYAGVYHDDLLLPKKYDVNLTAREVRDRFGVQCKDIFEHLFLRWKTQWKTRKAVWKVNVVIAVQYADWVEAHQDATPAEALAFLKTVTEPIRRVKDYVSGETRLMSRDEHREWLEAQQRELRRNWAVERFRADKAQAEALR
jgi:hypothetical protein